MESLPIYLVDDEEAIRRSLKLVLQLAGHEVVPFESGRHFLDAVKLLPPGCILLDVRMPEIDGLQVQQELKRREIAMPLVVMTGHGDLTIAVAALKAGADDFIEKPFERAQMLASIERACARLTDVEAYRASIRDAADAIGRLAERERAVLEAYADGQSTQAVAAALDLSVSTVEMVRIAIIEKLGGVGLTDAIRLTYLARAGV